MKYVLIIVLIGCCTYVGFGISKYYSNRKDFFSDFVLLLDKLRLDISFSKEKIGDIIASYTPVNKSFKTLNNNFLQILENGEFDNEKLFENINLLKDEEKNTITIFFKSLGRFDMENQTKQIESFKEEFTRFMENASKKKEKFGSLFIKLGFIIGVLISLLLV